MIKELSLENKKAETPLLLMKEIKKHFGGVEALKGVDFELWPNEIVSLLGDNGAGKSTLVKIICGVYEPDYGEIFLDGVKVKFSDPQQARNMGIETIFQDLALFNELDITTNLFVGREIIRGRVFLNKKVMDSMSRAALDKTGIDIKSLRQPMGQLSGGQKHAVAIARAVYLSGKPRIILMDEPTAGLAVKESNKLLETIKGLKKAGIAVILITHNLDDAFVVADRFVVLRSGLKVGEKLSKETNSLELIEMMIGVMENSVR